MGVAGSLRDAQVISTGNRQLVAQDGGLPALISADETGVGRSQRGPRNYTIDTLPLFAFSLAQSTRSVTLDLILAGTPVKSNIPNPLDSAPQALSKRTWSWWWPGLFKHAHGHAAVTSFADVPTVGPAWAAQYMTRNTFLNPVFPYLFFQFPTFFANGTDIPYGEYRLLLRALRISGDPSNENDYDIYVSEQVGYLEAL